MDVPNDSIVSGDYSVGNPELRSSTGELQCTPGNYSIVTKSQYRRITVSGNYYVAPGNYRIVTGNFGMLQYITDE